MMLTAEILAIYQELCESQEVHHIEAKKAKERIGDSVMQTICAFANTTGGYLLLGVSEPDQTHDNFWVSGVSNQDNILSQIQTNCRNQFTSIIAIDMGKAKTATIYLMTSTSLGLVHPALGLVHPALGLVHPALGLVRQ